jgi:phosphatidate phosphatase APP1
MTPSPIGILRSTFVATPEPTPNMPAFYASLESAFQPNWFYVSASPYNLYPFLRPFIHETYPFGPLLLRDASWVTPSGLLQTLTQGVQAFKVSRFERIHNWLPNRKVLCIGDSTQSDPEAYAEIYNRYPGWVKAIFIRKVLGLNGMEEKNKAERFEKAFEGIPADVWRVFEDPTELGEAVERLKTL